MATPDPDPDPDLDGAYALQTPDDNRAYYRDWAARYDTDFAATMQYRLPDLVAAALDGANGPVLDVGAGTGLLGLALAGRGVRPIDALDLSPEMLDVARAKGCYRNLIVADLTAPLPPLNGPYLAVASSGTFTHGHVGPEALDALLDVAAPGARFAFSVNAGVWEARGFAAALARLAPRIAHLAVADEPIYRDAPDPAHAGDRAMIVTFTRA